MRGNSETDNYGRTTEPGLFTDRGRWKIENQTTPTEDLIEE